MAGLHYRIDPTRPEGSRIRGLRFGGLPLDPQGDFTLVCNSYRAAGGGLYPHLADADIVAEEELVVPGDTAKEGRAGATSTSEQTVFKRGEGE